MQQDPLDLMYRHVLLRPRGDWQDKAQCAGMDPEIFFPTTPDGVMAAQEVCSWCVVQADCLEHAVEYEERKGIWGGTSERQRRELIIQRRKKKALEEEQKSA